MAAIVANVTVNVPAAPAESPAAAGNRAAGPAAETGVGQPFQILLALLSSTVTPTTDASDALLPPDSLPGFDDSESTTKTTDETPLGLFPFLPIPQAPVPVAVPLEIPATAIASAGQAASSAENLVEVEPPSATATTGPTDTTFRFDRAVVSPRPNVVAQPPLVTDTGREALTPTATPADADLPNPVHALGAVPTPPVLDSTDIYRSLRTGLRLQAEALTQTPVAPPPAEAHPFADELKALLTDESDRAPVPTTGTVAANPAPASPVENTPAVLEWRSVTPDQFPNEIVTRVRAMTTDGKIDFHLRLDPPELGRVQVRLVSERGDISAHVVVASDGVRQLIESQLPELRHRLESLGVPVSRFEVTQDPNTSAHGQNARPERYPWSDDAPPFVRPIPRPVPAAPSRTVAAGRIDVSA